MDTREALAQFISEEILHSDVLIAFDENLLDDGMVDSMGMLRLVGHIEQLFAVSVPPEDFTFENFRDLNSINTYLLRVMGKTNGE